MTLAAAFLSAVLLAGSIGLGLSAHELEPKPAPKEVGTATLFQESSHNGTIVGWLHGIDGKPISGIYVSLMLVNYAPELTGYSSRGSSAKSGRDGRFVFALEESLLSVRGDKSFSDIFRSKSLLGAEVSVNHHESQVAPNGETISSLMGRACFGIDYNSDAGLSAPEVSLRLKKLVAGSQQITASQMIVGVGIGGLDILDFDKGVFARAVGGRPLSILDSAGCEVEFPQNHRSFYNESTGEAGVVFDSGVTLLFQIPKFTGDVSPLVRGSVRSDPPASPESFDQPSFGLPGQPPSGGSQPGGSQPGFSRLERRAPE